MTKRPMKFSSISNLGKPNFRAQLLRWYDLNRRELPWRQTRDPYRVWISEIMLQQTRVAAVLDHYRRFLDRFPDVRSLARAREQTVLAAWSGLGYYRRARNLHACAKVIASEFDGNFPASAAELLKLPGIGRYTAAAIASIAFSEPTAVVDGNVERVLQRVTGNPNLPLNETWETANALLERERPGDFNQAMMELGATVCGPKEPKCLVCPIMKACVTRGRQPQPRRQVREIRSITLGLSRRDKQVFLTQRSRSISLMPGMWELPEVQTNGCAPLAQFKHSILNTDYDVFVFASETPVENGRWIEQSRLPRMALTGLARKILRHFEML